MRSEFVCEDRVCAAGYMKGAAVARSGLVTNARSYAVMGRQPPAQALPTAVRDWLAAEHGVINAAW